MNKGSSGGFSGGGSDPKMDSGGRGGWNHFFKWFTITISQSTIYDKLKYGFRQIGGGGNPKGVLLYILKFPMGCFNDVRGPKTPPKLTTPDYFFRIPYKKSNYPWFFCFRISYKKQILTTPELYFLEFLITNINSPETPFFLEFYINKY